MDSNSNTMSHSDLSEDQYDAFQRCLKGQNVFITGPGGCGKSYLLHTIVKAFSETNRISPFSNPTASIM